MRGAGSTEETHNDKRWPSAAADLLPIGEGGIVQTHPLLSHAGSSLHWFTWYASMLELEQQQTDFGSNGEWSYTMAWSMCSLYTGHVNISVYQSLCETSNDLIRGDCMQICSFHGISAPLIMRAVMWLIWGKHYINQLLNIALPVHVINMSYMTEFKLNHYESGMQSCCGGGPTIKSWAEALAQDPWCPLSPHHVLSSSEKGQAK